MAPNNLAGSHKASYTALAGALAVTANATSFVAGRADTVSAAINDHLLQERHSVQQRCTLRTLRRCSLQCRWSHDSMSE